ncbi:MAG: hypothetical protein V4577_10960 [Bacteroidota bacterium]
MKKNLIYTLLAAIILVVYSFTVKSYHKHIVKPVAKNAFSCNAVITSVTGVYTGPYTIQLTWTYTGSPTWFNYGGNYFCYSGSAASYSGNTTTATATVTIPYSAGCPGGGAYTGINGRITPYCADGTAGTDKVFAVTH